MVRHWRHAEFEVLIKHGDGDGQPELEIWHWREEAVHYCCFKSTSTSLLDSLV